MKKQFLTFFSFLALAVAAVPGIASAGDHSAHNTAVSVATTNSLVGVQGYDLVSYHSGTPAKGAGTIAAEHDGVTYLFATEANKKAFEASPEKFLPAYGGYCAYGVAVGKKFVGDPKVWKVVDGTLYLNLNTKIQGIWNKDVSGNITKANGQWTTIKDKSASDL